MSSPEAAIGLKALQLPSGVAVSPVRTLRPTEVPAGVSASQVSAPHWTGSPASKTREVKVAGLA